MPRIRGLAASSHPRLANCLRARHRGIFGGGLRAATPGAFFGSGPQRASPARRDVPLPQLGHRGTLDPSPWPSGSAAAHSVKGALQLAKALSSKVAPRRVFDAEDAPSLAPAPGPFSGTATPPVTSTSPPRRLVFLSRAVTQALRACALLALPTRTQALADLAARWPGAPGHGVARPPFLLVSHAFDRRLPENFSFSLARKWCTSQKFASFSCRLQTVGSALWSL